MTDGWRRVDQALQAALLRSPDDQHRARGRVMAVGAGIMTVALTAAVAISPLQAVGRPPEAGAVPAAQSRPEFEVADVHVSAPRADGRPAVMEGSGLVRGGHYEVFNATLLDLVRMAYGVNPDAIVGGPTSMAVDRFDVIAKTPDGTAAVPVNAMLQALLADRFSLVIRNEMRPRPAWVLSRGTGPKLKRATRADASGCTPVYERERLSCRGVTMDAFVEWLRSAPRAMLPVLNQTALEGEWDFDLDGLPNNFVRGVSDGCQTLRLLIGRAWKLQPQQDTSDGFRDLAFGETPIEGASRVLENPTEN